MFIIIIFYFIIIIILYSMCWVNLRVYVFGCIYPQKPNECMARKQWYSLLLT